MKKQYESPKMEVLVLQTESLMVEMSFIPPNPEDDTPAATRRRSIWGDDEKQETSSPWK